MASGTLWKRDEIETLLLLFQVKNKPIHEVAERLGRTPDAVRVQLNGMGLSSRSSDDNEGIRSSTGGIITHPEPYLTVHKKVYPKSSRG